MHNVIAYHGVAITISPDGKTLWVNVDAESVLRVNAKVTADTKPLVVEIQDRREEE